MSTQLHYENIPVFFALAVISSDSISCVAATPCTGPTALQSKHVGLAVSFPTSTSGPLLVTEEQTPAEKEKPRTSAPRSVSPLSVKSISAWLPEAPRRGPVSGRALQSATSTPTEPRSSGWWAVWEGLSHSGLVREQLGVWFRQGGGGGGFLRWPSVSALETLWMFQWSAVRSGPGSAGA